MDPAGARAERAGEHPEQGGLAGARGSDDPGEGARGDGEVDAGEGAVTGGVGMIAAYHLDVPPGAAITLVAALGFVAAALAGPAARRLRT